MRKWEFFVKGRNLLFIGATGSGVVVGACCKNTCGCCGKNDEEKGFKNPNIGNPNKGKPEEKDLDKERAKALDELNKSIFDKSTFKYGGEKSVACNQICRALGIVYKGSYKWGNEKVFEWCDNNFGRFGNNKKYDGECFKIKSQAGRRLFFSGIGFTNKEYIEELKKCDESVIVLKRDKVKDDFDKFLYKEEQIPELLKEGYEELDGKPFYDNIYGYIEDIANEKGYTIKQKTEFIKKYGQNDPNAQALVKGKSTKAFENYCRLYDDTDLFIIRVGGGKELNYHFYKKKEAVK